MAGTRRFALNVLMNWVATGVGMLVPFFLTPVVVRHLGPAAYGVWILAAATVSYLNLLDLGMRSAVIRFVSKAWAQGAIEELRAVVAAALWFRLLIAAVVGVLSVVLAINFPRLFQDSGAAAPCGADDRAAVRAGGGGVAGLWRVWRGAGGDEPV